MTIDVKITAEDMVVGILRLIAGVIEPNDPDIVHTLIGLNLFDFLIDMEKRGLIVVSRTLPVDVKITEAGRQVLYFSSLDQSID